MTFLSLVIMKVFGFFQGKINAYLFYFILFLNSLINLFLLQLFLLFSPVTSSSPSELIMKDWRSSNSPNRIGLKFYIIGHRKISIYFILVHPHNWMKQTGRQDGYCHPLVEDEDTEGHGGNWIGHRHAASGVEDNTDSRPQSSSSCYGEAGNW